MDFLTRQTRALSFQLACSDHTYPVGFCDPPFAGDFFGRSRRRLYARHSLDRLGIVAPGSLSSPGALFVFVASNIAHWLGSSVIRQWLWVMIVGTFGTVLLRPYYLVVGVPTTVVAWLMNRNDLLWAPRFFSTETLIWCITLVGFASIARTVSNSSKRMRTAVLTAAIVIAALAVCAQLALVPWFARGAYLLRSTSLYSASERQEADAVFARYRQEGKPEEPVIASTMLFRYAHDRNLFWLTRLHGRPEPIWILGDSADAYAPFRISTRYNKRGVWNPSRRLQIT